MYQYNKRGKLKYRLLPYQSKDEGNQLWILDGEEKYQFYQEVYVKLDEGISCPNAAVEEVGQGEGEGHVLHALSCDHVFLFMATQLSPTSHTNTFTRHHPRVEKSN